MSQSQTIELTCLLCHREFAAEIWTVVNVDTEPYLKTHLLEGRLNIVTCPVCHEQFFVLYPFVYHESASEQVICHAPKEWENDERRQNAVSGLLEALWEELESEPPKDYFQRPIWLDDINNVVRLIQSKEHLISQLAEQVRSGKLTLSDGIAYAQTNAFLNELSEEDINTFDDLLRQLAKIRTNHPYISLPAWLNFVAALAHPNTSSSVKRDCGFTLLDLMPTDMKARKEICQVLISGINRLEEPELWGEVVFQLGNAFYHLFDANRAENLEQAIRCFTAALEIYTQEASPENWAMIQNNLGNAYYDRIRGDRSENIEGAIRYFTTSLEVYTQEALSQNWVMTQNNLGNAYSSRIKGIRAENIELAIGYYTNALSVRTQKASPQQWAMTQNNLGNAYYNRIRGDKAENIEQAIACYAEAKKVYTKEAFPKDWALVQNHLGIAMMERIKGNRAENIEKAVACYTKAEEVYTEEAFPQNWAMVQNNLGIAMMKRIKGNRAENVEGAIQHYNAALKIRTQAAFPYDWADTQNNLGTAYWSRIKGDEAENIEQAISCFTAALKVRTQESTPQDWAMTQHNLGNAYRTRIKGDKAENIDQAIENYKAALMVCTQEAFPHEWATTQNCLGLAFRERINGNRAENLELAIRCFLAALEVRTQSTSPPEWATTQSDLGTALQERIQGDKAKNIECAIQCFRAAEEVHTPTAFPFHWATIQNNLGIAYMKRIDGDKALNKEEAAKCFQNAIDQFLSWEIWYGVNNSTTNLGWLHYHEQEWEDAYTAYREAIAAMKRIRTEALMEAERTRLIREHIGTFERLVICCLRTGRNNEAVEYAERGKARNLIDNLIRRDLRWRNVPKALRDKYEELLSTARNLEFLMQRTSTSTTGQSLTTEQVAQIRNDFLQTNQEIEAVLTKIRAIEKDFLLDAEPLRLTDMQQLAREAQATTIQLMVTQEGTFAFIITGAGDALDGKDIIRVPTFTSDSLSRLVVDDWLPSYNSQKKEVWFSCIEQTLEELYTRLFAPIHRRLKELDVRRIVLIPNRGLGILPLHAMSYRENGKKRYLLDDYEITYAPSCGILQRCLDRENEERTKEQFVGVANPTEDLDFSSWEVALIQQHLASKPARVLMGKQATKSAVLEAMPNANLHHFACHGAYKLENPLESRLALADGELTLGEIFASYDAGQAWLVVLSACETGLTDNWRDVSDEYVGLPAGFLYAGAPSVVASLWKIRDLASALLVTRMYENLLNRDMGRAEALREAQIWLRDLKKEKAEALLQEMGHLSSSTMQVRDIVLLDETEANKPSVDLFAQALSQVSEEEFPEHPYYWAGFQCVGAF